MNPFKKVICDFCDSYRHCRCINLQWYCDDCSKLNKEDLEIIRMIKKQDIKIKRSLRAWLKFKGNNT